MPREAEIFRVTSQPRTQPNDPRRGHVHAGRIGGCGHHDRDHPLIAEVTSYTELIEGLRTRVGELGVRYQDFDELAGFPAGLTGKVFGMLQVKRLGPEKMFDAIRAAGLRIRIEVDPEQLAKMQGRISENFNPRQANQARPGNSASPASSAILSRVFKPLARMGGKARWRKTSKKDQREHMRLMGIASGKKRRKLMKRRARQRAAAHKARKANG